MEKSVQRKQLPFSNFMAIFAKYGDHPGERYLRIMFPRMVVFYLFARQIVVPAEDFEKFDGGRGQIPQGSALRRNPPSRQNRGRRGKTRLVAGDFYLLGRSVRDGMSSRNLTCALLFVNTFTT
jgi:hypothetical protein